jgi:DNA-binding HxlR family transcriptional regulator
MRRPRGYGQFCPVAKAAEVVAERWMPIVLRELLYGSTRFQELRRGIPLISPTMLSQRLRELVDSGLVARIDQPNGGAEYRLTAAGEDMRPIIEQLGVWGQRWVHHHIKEDDLDPAFLMWAVHRHLRVSALPPGRWVLLFEFPERRPSERRWWVIVSRGEADLCLKRPGHDVDVTVTTDVRTLTMVYLGRIDPSAAQRASKIAVEGATPLVRTFAKWCARSKFASITPVSSKAAGSR